MNPFGRVPPGIRVPVGDGRAAFVRRTGTDRGRPPVLLLHGLGATSALNWAPVFGPLGRRTQVLAVDHCGHGRGPRVGNRFRLAQCADDAAAVLRNLTDRPAVVVGYSMGGPIAQLLAHRHPELVAGLVLSATARDFRGKPAERLRFGTLGLAAGAAGIGPAALLPNVVPVLPGALEPLGWAASELRRHEPSAVLAAAASLGRFTSREWIGELDVPAVVLVHANDRLVPPSRQRKLADTLPDAERVELPIDHLGVVRDAEVFVPALVDAYNRVASRTRPKAPSRLAS